jgi:hypothetical protein
MKTFGKLLILILILLLSSCKTTPEKPETFPDNPCMEPIEYVCQAPSTGGDLIERYTLLLKCLNGKDAYAKELKDYARCLEKYSQIILKACS